MPTLKSRLGSPTQNVAHITASHDSSGNAQADTATPIPTEIADDGWIDCRAHTEIHATIKAVGAEAIITAEVKTTEASDPASLLLSSGSVTADTTALILDATIRFGFIRFLAAGEVGEGNTVDLHVLLK